MRPCWQADQQCLFEKQQFYSQFSKMHTTSFRCWLARGIRKKDSAQKADCCWPLYGLCAAYWWQCLPLVPAVASKALANYRNHCAMILPHCKQVTGRNDCLFLSYKWSSRQIGGCLMFVRKASFGTNDKMMAKKNRKHFLKTMLFTLTIRMWEKYFWKNKEWKTKHYGDATNRWEQSVAPAAGPFIQMGTLWELQRRSSFISQK